MIHLKKFNEAESDKNNVEKWAIYAGLGGGFGGANFSRFYTGTREEAESEAWQDAVEEYEQYSGLHGLRSISDIMEEDGVDEEDAITTYEEERESWLDYHVELFEINKTYE